MTVKEVKWGTGVVPPIKILVVDDFEEFRRFVCALLIPKTEFQFAEASDGLEAFRKAKELQPDLIVLDIALPSLNGLEVAKRIREFAPGTKILFLSGESSPDVVREALNLGALGYVHKPELQSDLVPAIEAVLKGELFVSRDLKLNGRTDAPRRHDVLFYSADSVLLEHFSRFITAALKANDVAIAILTESHRDGLVQKLKGQGFDVDGAIQQGTYIPLDAANMLSTIMVNDVPDSVAFFKGLCALIESSAKAAKTECPRIALCAECVGLLCAQGNIKAALQLEETGNDLIELYDLDRCFHGEEDDHGFDSVCGLHAATYAL